MPSFRGEIFKAVKVEGIGLIDWYQQGDSVLWEYSLTETQEKKPTRFYRNQYANCD
ncbi:hypothetical protein [Candidatus Nitrospira neomarina]|uniref:Uncharacterized protein n=1 Tax=Candidatus Nitrospira neomarina TaxID=3020899 RepID=A0AA96GR04_9BACT|nr:hypothetical protein [Candidatus Nitrospira neomarina]WNM63738.1 hypothetical protein PQG83_08285 [Candidatus Nitrospira neomarina]